MSGSNFATFVSGLVIAFITNWKLTLIVCTILPCMLGTALTMRYFTDRYMRRSLDAYAESGNLAEETLASVRTVIAFGAEERVARRYERQLVNAERNGIRKSIAFGIGIGVFMLVIYCGSVDHPWPLSDSSSKGMLWRFGSGGI